jgi:hypothetical protein
MHQDDAINNVTTTGASIRGKDRASPHKPIPASKNCLFKKLEKGSTLLEPGIGQ